MSSNKRFNGNTPGRFECFIKQPPILKKAQDNVFKNLYRFPITGKPARTYWNVENPNVRRGLNVRKWLKWPEDYTVERPYRPYKRRQEKHLDEDEDKIKVNMVSNEDGNVWSYLKDNMESFKKVREKKLLDIVGAKESVGIKRGSQRTLPSKLSNVKKIEEVQPTGLLLRDTDATVKCVKRDLGEWKYYFAEEEKDLLTHQWKETEFEEAVFDEYLQSTPEHISNLYKNSILQPYVLKAMCNHYKKESNPFPNAGMIIYENLEKFTAKQTKDFLHDRYKNRLLPTDGQVMRKKPEKYFDPYLYSINNLMSKPLKAYLETQGLFKNQINSHLRRNKPTKLKEKYLIYRTDENIAHAKMIRNILNHEKTKVKNEFKKTKKVVYDDPSTTRFQTATDARIITLKNTYSHFLRHLLEETQQLKSQIVRNYECGLSDEILSCLIIRNRFDAYRFIFQNRMKSLLLPIPIQIIYESYPRELFELLSWFTICRFTFIYKGSIEFDTKCEQPVFLDIEKMKAISHYRYWYVHLLEIMDRLTSNDDVVVRQMIFVCPKIRSSQSLMNTLMSTVMSHHEVFLKSYLKDMISLDSSIGGIDPSSHNLMEMSQLESKLNLKDARNFKKQLILKKIQCFNEFNVANYKFVPIEIPSETESNLNKKKELQFVKSFYLSKKLRNKSKNVRRRITFYNQIIRIPFPESYLDHDCDYCNQLYEEEKKKARKMTKEQKVKQTTHTKYVSVSQEEKCQSFAITKNTIALKACDSVEQLLKKLNHEDYEPPSYLNYQLTGKASSVRFRGSKLRIETSQMNGDGVVITDKGRKEIIVKGNDISIKSSSKHRALGCILPEIWKLFDDRFIQKITQILTKCYDHVDWHDISDWTLQHFELIITDNLGRYLKMMVEQRINEIFARTFFYANDQNILTDYLVDDQSYTFFLKQQLLGFLLTELHRVIFGSGTDTLSALIEKINEEIIYPYWSNEDRKKSTEKKMKMHAQLKLDIYDEFLQFFVRRITVLTIHIDAPTYDGFLNETLYRTKETLTNLSFRHLMDLLTYCPIFPSNWLTRPISALNSSKSEFFETVLLTFVIEEENGINELFDELLYISKRTALYNMITFGHMNLNLKHICFGDKSTAYSDDEKHGSDKSTAYTSQMHSYTERSSYGYASSIGTLTHSYKKIYELLKKKNEDFMEEIKTKKSTIGKLSLLTDDLSTSSSYDSMESSMKDKRGKKSIRSTDPADVMYSTNLDIFVDQDGNEIDMEEYKTLAEFIKLISLMAEVKGRVDSKLVLEIFEKCNIAKFDLQTIQNLIGDAVNDKFFKCENVDHMKLKGIVAIDNLQSLFHSMGIVNLFQHETTLMDRDTVGLLHQDLNVYKIKAAFTSLITIFDSASSNISIEIFNNGDFLRLVEYFLDYQDTVTERTVNNLMDKMYEVLGTYFERVVFGVHKPSRDAYVNLSAVLSVLLKTTLKKYLKFEGNSSNKIHALTIRMCQIMTKLHEDHPEILSICTKAMNSNAYLIQHWKSVEEEASGNLFDKLKEGPMKHLIDKIEILLADMHDFRSSSYFTELLDLIRKSNWLFKAVNELEIPLVELIREPYAQSNRKFLNSINNSLPEIPKSLNNDFDLFEIAREIKKITYYCSTLNDNLTEERYSRLQTKGRNLLHDLHGKIVDIITRLLEKYKKIFKDYILNIVGKIIYMLNTSTNNEQYDNPEMFNCFIEAAKQLLAKSLMMFNSLDLTMFGSASWIPQIEKIIESLMNFSQDLDNDRSDISHGNLVKAAAIVKSKSCVAFTNIAYDVDRSIIYSEISVTYHVNSMLMKEVMLCTQILTKPPLSFGESLMEMVNASFAHLDNPKLSRRVRCSKQYPYLTKILKKHQQMTNLIGAKSFNTLISVNNDLLIKLLKCFTLINPRIMAMDFAPAKYQTHFRLVVIKILITIQQFCMKDSGTSPYPINSSQKFSEIRKIVHDNSFNEGGTDRTFQPIISFMKLWISKKTDDDYPKHISSIGNKATVLCVEGLLSSKDLQGDLPRFARTLLPMLMHINHKLMNCVLDQVIPKVFINTVNQFLKTSREMKSFQSKFMQDIERHFSVDRLTSFFQSYHSIISYLPTVLVDLMDISEPRRTIIRFLEEVHEIIIMFINYIFIKHETDLPQKEQSIFVFHLQNSQAFLIRLLSMGMLKKEAELPETAETALLQYMKRYLLINKTNQNLKDDGKLKESFDQLHLKISDTFKLLNEISLRKKIMFNVNLLQEHAATIVKKIVILQQMCTEDLLANIHFYAGNNDVRAIQLIANCKHELRLLRKKKKVNTKDQLAEISKLEDLNMRLSLISFDINWYDHFEWIVSEMDIFKNIIITSEDMSEEVISEMELKCMKAIDRITAQYTYIPYPITPALSIIQLGVYQFSLIQIFGVLLITAAPLPSLVSLPSLQQICKLFDGTCTTFQHSFIKNLYDVNTKSIHHKFQHVFDMYFQFRKDILYPEEKCDNFKVFDQIDTLCQNIAELAHNVRQAKIFNACGPLIGNDLVYSSQLFRVFTVLRHLLQLATGDYLVNEAFNPSDIVMEIATSLEGLEKIYKLLVHPSREIEEINNIFRTLLDRLSSEFANVNEFLTVSKQIVSEAFESVHSLFETLLDTELNTTIEFLFTTKDLCDIFKFFSKFINLRLRIESIFIEYVHKRNIVSICSLFLEFAELYRMLNGNTFLSKMISFRWRTAICRLQSLVKEIMEILHSLSESFNENTVNELRNTALHMYQEVYLIMLCLRKDVVRKELPKYTKDEFDLELTFVIGYLTKQLEPAAEMEIPSDVPKITLRRLQKIFERKLSSSLLRPTAQRLQNLLTSKFFDDAASQTSTHENNYIEITEELIDLAPSVIKIDYLNSESINPNTNRQYEDLKQETMVNLKSLNDISNVKMNTISIYREIGNRKEDLLTMRNNYKRFFQYGDQYSSRSINLQTRKHFATTDEMMRNLDYLNTSSIEKTEKQLDQMRKTHIQFINDNLALLFDTFDEVSFDEFNKMDRNESFDDFVGKIGDMAHAYIKKAVSQFYCNLGEVFDIEPETKKKMIEDTILRCNQIVDDMIKALRLEGNKNQHFSAGGTANMVSSSIRANIKSFFKENFLTAITQKTVNISPDMLDEDQFFLKPSPSRIDSPAEQAKKLKERLHRKMRKSYARPFKKERSDLSMSIILGKSVMDNEDKFRRKSEETKVTENLNNLLKNLGDPKYNMVNGSQTVIEYLNNMGMAGEEKKLTEKVLKDGISDLLDILNNENPSEDLLKDAEKIAEQLRTLALDTNLEKQDSSTLLNLIEKLKDVVKTQNIFSRISEKAEEFIEKVTNYMTSYGTSSETSSTGQYILRTLKEIVDESNERQKITAKADRLIRNLEDMVPLIQDGEPLSARLTTMADSIDSLKDLPKEDIALETTHNVDSLNKLMKLTNLRSEIAKQSEDLQQQFTKIMIEKKDSQSTGVGDPFVNHMEATKRMVEETVEAIKFTESFLKGKTDKNRRYTSRDLKKHGSFMTFDTDSKFSSDGEHSTSRSRSISRLSKLPSEQHPSSHKTKRDRRRRKRSKTSKPRSSKFALDPSYSRLSFSAVSRRTKSLMRGRHRPTGTIDMESTVYSADLYYSSDDYYSSDYSSIDDSEPFAYPRKLRIHWTYRVLNYALVLSFSGRLYKSLNPVSYLNRRARTSIHIGWDMPKLQRAECFIAKIREFDEVASEDEDCHARNKLINTRIPRGPEAKINCMINDHSN
ncbi:hypothetical protein SNEBB_008786 [Seison nebaliae]|nr:hypothetical protein SNEBB_008786 [Seison nebaliae]